MGKKNYRKKDPWKGIPEELKLMCLVELRGADRGYCTLPALRFLIDNMYNYESFYFNVTPYDVLKWINVVIESCLFPLEQYEEEWVEYKEEIMKVLQHADSLLQKYAPSDYSTGHRVEYDDDVEINIIEIKQKLNVYFCVWYMYMEDWNKLESRLEDLLCDTKHNVQYMLICSDAEQLAAADDWSCYHYSGVSDKWEIINWLMKEFLPLGKASWIFARVYETYTAYLSDIHLQEKSKTSRHMLLRAEKYLNRLCEYILDEIDDYLADYLNEDEDEPDESDEEYNDLIAAKEEFEKKYGESQQRIRALDNPVQNENTKET